MKFKNYDKEEIVPVYFRPTIVETILMKEGPVVWMQAMKGEHNQPAPYTVTPDNLLLLHNPDRVKLRGLNDGKVVSHYEVEGRGCGYPLSEEFRDKILMHEVNEVVHMVIDELKNI